MRVELPIQGLPRIEARGRPRKAGRVDQNQDGLGQEFPGGKHRK